jgi:hypothetical protein
MRSFLSAQKVRDGFGLNSVCCSEYPLDSNPILAAIGYRKGPEGRKPVNQKRKVPKLDHSDGTKCSGCRLRGGSHRQRIAVVGVLVRGPAPRWTDAVKDVGTTADSDAAGDAGDACAVSVHGENIQVPLSA